MQFIIVFYFVIFMNGIECQLNCIDFYFLKLSVEFVCGHKLLINDSNVNVHMFFLYWDHL